MALRPKALRQDITAVVFACDEGDLSRFSISTGPCVPMQQGGKSFVSPLVQDGGETPSLTAALYTALTERLSAEALVLVGREGNGTLSECSAPFVTAMAASCEESLRLANEDEARGDDDLTGFVEHENSLSEAWMRAGRWPREVVGLHNRLVRLGVAREAVMKGLRVFVWHGPPVPQFVIHAGQGPYRPAR